MKPYMDPAPSERRLPGWRVEAGCSHIFGLFKELHFTLRALIGKRRSDRLPITDKTTSATHGETCSFNKSV